MYFSTDGFLAVVDGKSETDGQWLITPQVIEVDGSDHIQVEAITRDGLVPTEGDTVFVLTMRNNLDLEPINRTFGSSASNCVIVGIVKTDADPKYVLEGNYDFKNDVNITENLTVNGNATIDKNLEVKGDLIAANVKVSGSLIIDGKDFTIHMHSPGTYSNVGGPVTGASGGVV